ncbi:alpha/beta-hydrolase [Hymenopellis radicata]|nr:alpha/beta-hydrolase [Hymenopellis radicata]
MAKAFDKITLKISSATPGWNLDVWQYLPVAGSQPFPVIVMAHGLTATKKMRLDAYAERFAEHGYACLVFDYRRWGDSDGSPRCALNISEQHGDYRTVVDFARTQEAFDSQRVVLWGTSYAGGHALTLARSLNPIAVVTQCSYTGAAPRPPLGTFLKLGLSGIWDALRQGIGLAPFYIQAASEPGSLTGSSVFQLRGYKPVHIAAEIKCPVLLVMPEDDKVCLPQGAMDVAAKAPLCELVTTEGGHMDVYPDGKVFQLSLNSQLEFLRKHVPVLQV